MFSNGCLDLSVNFLICDKVFVKLFSSLQYWSTGITSLGVLTWTHTMKNLEVGAPMKITITVLKIDWFVVFNEEMPLKDADQMANSADHDQSATKGDGSKVIKNFPAQLS